MELETVAVIGLCAFLALWYGAGYLYNCRRGQRLFRWLEPGLDVLGGDRETGWLGSAASGARINVIHAAPPFRRLEITLLLENREIPLLWLVDRLRGRRDRLIVKATLRSPRSGEVEVGSGRRRVAHRRDPSWTRQEGPHGSVVAYRGPGAEQRIAELAPWLRAYGASLHRFSRRKTDPHVQLHLQATKLLATPSATFLGVSSRRFGDRRALTS